jgi:hypothetical protein
MVYIITAIIALVIIAIFFIFVQKNTGQKQPSGIVYIGLLFIIAGIIFGEDRLFGYSLIGLGAILSIFDIIVKWRRGNIP